MRLIFLLLWLAIPSTLYAQWLPEDAFPEGEYLETFMLDGDNVIAGGDRLYRSSNRGITWREVTTVQNYMRVTQIERSGDAVLALGDTALWRLLDGGETWSVALSWGYLVSPGYGSPAQLAVAPQRSIAVATKSWVELSSDNGVTWRRTARGPGLYNHPSALALVGGRIHIGETAGHRYSTDGGATWLESPPVDSRRVAPLQFVWTPDGTLHAAAATGYYYSSDSGSTWMRRVPSDTLNAWIGAMAIEADTIWTAHDGYLMTSTDRGATWRNVVPSSSRLGAILRLAWADDTLWAASSGLGFVWSTDDGLTWHERNQGMSGQINDNNGLFADYDAFYDFGRFALLKTPVGILRTLDSGRVWTKHDSLVATTDRRLGGYIFDIVSHDDTLYLLNPRGLHYSTDGGVSWTAGELGGHGEGHFHRALEVVGDTLFAAGGMFGVVRFVRENGQWRRIDSTIGVDGPVLLARGDTVFAGGSPTLWRSTDRGARWQNLTGLASAPGVQSVHVSPSGIVYAVTEAIGMPALWNSRDGGETWSAIEVRTSELGGSLDSVLVEGAFTFVDETLFVGLNDRYGPNRGVLRSTDRGETWQQIANGRLTNANVLALGSHGAQLLAWTRSYGIWRRSLSEVVANVPLVEADPALRMHLAPNPASGLVSLQLDDVVTVTVADALGRTVLVTREATFDAGRFSNGLYVVVARDRSGLVVGSSTLLVQR